jgi:hypothetical protein
MMASGDHAILPTAGARVDEPSFASFEAFLSASADVVEALGTFAGSTGRLEKSTNLSMDEMAKRFMATDIERLIQAMGPEIAPLFVKVSLRLGILRTANPDKMNPDEKIAFEGHMKELAADIRRFLEAVRVAAQREGKA